MEEEKVEDVNVRIHKRKGKFRQIIIIAVIYSLFGLMILLLKSDLIELFFRENYRKGLAFIDLLGVITTMVGVMAAVFAYLQDAKSINRLTTELEENRNFKEVADKLQTELDIIKNQLTENTNVTDSDKLINQLIYQNLSDDKILDAIETKFGESITKRSVVKMIELDFNKSVGRIEFEIIRLRRNANVNLSVGGISTSVAISFIGYEIYTSKLNLEKMPELLTHFIPRIAIVIFIEVFAFFFLKIYRKTLDEIKYYNNERSNIELKILALKTSLLTDRSSSIDVALSDLSKTERNFILNKDQSTIDLEREKIESSYYKNIAETLNGFIKSNK